MSLLKYKVLQSEIKNAAADLPEKAVPLGVVVDAETKQLVVAFMMLYSDWAKEFPDGAKKEAIIENAAT